MFQFHIFSLPEEAISYPSSELVNSQSPGGVWPGAAAGVGIGAAGVPLAGVEPPAAVFAEEEAELNSRSLLLVDETILLPKWSRLSIVVDEHSEVEFSDKVTMFNFGVKMRLCPQMLRMKVLMYVKEAPPSFPAKYHRPKGPIWAHRRIISKCAEGAA